jgi:hypothetical protein
MRVHHAQLKKGYEYVDATGEITSFIKNDGQESKAPSGKTAKTIESPICIHHYIVKSKQEYTDKKRLRGDAMVGSEHDRGEAYFHFHDRNDKTFSLKGINFKTLEETIKSLELRLNKETNLKCKFAGSIDACNERFIAGWVLAKNSKSNRPVKVNIFVNGKYLDTIFSNGYRKDLAKKFTSSGNYSFHYTFPTKLEKGDQVLIRPCTSNFKFAHQPRVINSEGQFIMVVTYARSGSTLIQNLINSIDGFKIRGENHNALFYLYKSYKAILYSKQHAKNKTPQDWPFYLAEKYDENQFFEDNVNSFINNIIKPNAMENNIGFKEVKYTDFGDDLVPFLVLLNETIPNLKIVFNFRDHESVANSAFQRKVPKNDLLKKLELFEKQAITFNNKYPKSSVVLSYEQYVANADGFEKLFEFLGVEYDAELAANVLSKKLMHCK